MGLDAMQAVVKAKEFIAQTGKTFFNVSGTEKNGNVWVVYVETFGQPSLVEIDAESGDVLKYAPTAKSE